MNEAITLIKAAETLKKPLDDLYGTCKSGVKSRLKNWKANNNINALYRKISCIQKVKTIWQVNKEVNLKEFYYPSKIVINNKSVNINKADKLPLETSIIIKGTVGQGKSIFLRYICSQELKIGNRIPVFIELRKIDDNTTIRDLIFSTLDAWGFDIDEDIFDYFAKSGKFLFLLDGFDEITSAHIQKTISQLENWSDKYNALRFIITSRPNSGIERSSRFRVFDLAPLEPEDQNGIISKLTPNSSQGNEIISALENSSSGIRDLITTPLMATLLIIVYKSSQRIPEQFSEFYEDLFQTLLFRHDKSKPGYFREKQCNVNERKLQEIFEAFCFHSSQENSSSFSHKEVYNVAEWALKNTESLCNSSSFINDIEKVCCLLIEEGFHYHFVHKSVREFYSASFVRSRNEKFAKEFYSRMLKGQWRNWVQELSFLAQIDKYRFSVYFLLPYINQTAKRFDLSLTEDIPETEKILAILDHCGSEIEFESKEYMPKLIRSKSRGMVTFPGIFSPHECIAQLAFSKMFTLRKPLTDQQKYFLLKNSECGFIGAECDFEGEESNRVMSGLAYIENIGVKEELIDCARENIRILIKMHQELTSYIENEERKVNILDML